MATKYLDKDGLEYFYNKIKGQIGGGKQSDWNETDTTDLAYIKNKPEVNKLISTDDGNGNVTFSYQTLLNVENLVDGSATGSLRNRYSATEDSSYTIGQYATALGNGTKASGNYSHAEGYGTTASGSISHAEGNGTTASGSYSHAEGSGTATKRYSHAEGEFSTASGDDAHAEGVGSVASGRASHAQNMETIAASSSQTALGKYNIEDSNDTYAVIVGNGTSDSNRSNALTVDWSGNVTANDFASGNITLATLFNTSKMSQPSVYQSRIDNMTLYHYTIGPMCFIHGLFRVAISGAWADMAVATGFPTPAYNTNIPLTAANSSSHDSVICYINPQGSLCIHSVLAQYTWVTVSGYYQCNL